MTAPLKRYVHCMRCGYIVTGVTPDQAEIAVAIHNRQFQSEYPPHRAYSYRHHERLARPRKPRPKRARWDCLCGARPRLGEFCSDCGRNIDGRTREMVFDSPRGAHG